MQPLIHDLKYAIRALTRTPAFTLSVVLVLALGIGSTTAIFSLVDATLLRPLPFTEPDRLMMIWEDTSEMGFPQNTPAPANYFSWRADSRAFVAMAAAVGGTWNLTGDGEPIRLGGVRTTSNLAEVLGVEPVLGRFFTDAEDQSGAAPVAVISYGLWQRHFGADAGIVGTDVLLNNRATTVVGVMPARMPFPTTGNDVWVPTAFSEAEAAQRRSHYLNVVGRLAPDASYESAAADMDRIAAVLEAEYPASNTNVGAVVIPLEDHYVGDVRSGFLLLLGAVGAVLLIACANIANLLLVRSSGRGREIAVRIALGAGRMRLVRQMMTESLLLALSGGVLGVAFAWFSFDILAGLIPDAVAGAVGLDMDVRVLGVALLVALVTGVVFGLAPALTASQVRLSETLQNASSRAGITSASRRFRDVLVVGEVALTVALLIGAGLLIRSFASVRGLDPGYMPDGVLTVRMDLPASKYGAPAPLSGFYRDVLERVEALPGVESAGFVSFLPLTNRGGSNGFRIEGRPEPEPGARPDANYRLVTKDYFRTMGIPLKSGRLFDSGDHVDAPWVLVINETMARQYWPGEDPIGKRINRSTSQPWFTIVGIVGDVRGMGLEAPVRAQMYRPVEQDLNFSFFSPRNLAIRTVGDPLSLAAAVRDQVWAVDADQPIAEVRLLGAFLDDEVFGRRTQTLLLGAFSVLALIVASVGLYGVLSYAVSYLTREIGIRVALGAERGTVLRMILRQGMGLAAMGCAVGLGLAYVLGGVMSSMLFGVEATDPLTFLSVPVVLTAVALVASLIPARRATKIDPMVALRYE